ncbi:MAG: acyl-CoA dehydrogenase family protein [Polyangiaceae bacterium]
MPFFQAPPALGNQYLGDRLLRAYLERVVPEDVRKAIEPELSELGELSGGSLYQQLLAQGEDTPQLKHWDAWGNRVDEIELTPLWKTMAKIAAEKGLVGAAYERKYGRFSRIQQFALNYVVDASSAVYSCPLAMTDGAARTLINSKNQPLIDRAVSRLASRDPATAWTSGQWMTERTGGSDVAISETVARADAANPGKFRLFGTKWFTSATTSQMALTLARPEGNPPGGSGLALFYVETRHEDGRLREGIAVNRLKDKLGTRMVPTAELTLDGVLAEPVAGLRDGIKNITPMLAITRTWNAVGATTGMHRTLALARDYAKKRVAFGAPLAQKSLHADTLAAMHAELEGAFLMAFRAIELIGKDESGEIDERESQLLRLLTPLAKLTTGKQAVAVISEGLEAFGGAGYIEDTGLPRLLRDAQVLPIWEGTTNVLALDVLRALGKGTGLDAVRSEIERCKSKASDHKELAELAELALRAYSHAELWALRIREEGVEALEAGARRFALTLGRSLQLALIVEHAAWGLAKGDRRSAAAARLFARAGVDLIKDEDFKEDAKLLVSYDD